MSKKRTQAYKHRHYHRRRVRGKTRLQKLAYVKRLIYKDWVKKIIHDALEEYDRKYIFDPRELVPAPELSK